MIVIEPYNDRSGRSNLVKIFSDSGYMIHKLNTSIVRRFAIEPENTDARYVETNVKIPNIYTGER